MFSAALVSVIFSACGASGGGGSSDDGTDAADGVEATDATDATDAADSADATDGTDAADATDGTDAADATDGTDGSTGELPDCQFQPPLGAKCNPYKQCDSGCASGEICTATIQNGGTRLSCTAAGDVPPAGACDAETGPYCQEGTCIDGECRAFCVDSIDCKNGGSCSQAKGIPGKPTVCGTSQVACDPTAPSEGCPADEACFLNNDATTDCKVPAGAGEFGEPCSSTVADCRPGHICTPSGDGSICAALCSEAAGSCATLCPVGSAAKPVSGGYTACLPGGEPPDSPDLVPCDLLAQDCAGEAQGCYPTQGGTFCLIAGTTSAGNSCAGTNDCKLGAFCFSNGQCVTVCDKSDATNALCETGVNAQCVEIGGGAGYCDE